MSKTATGLSKKGNLYLIITLIIIFGIIIPQATFQVYTRFLSSVSQPVITNPSLASSAWCFGASSIVSVGSPPGTCYTGQVKLGIQLVDAGSTAAVVANKYSCRTFVNSGGGWVAYENILTAASTTTCNSVFTYTPGWQVFVIICEQTTACGSVGAPGGTLKATYAGCLYPSSAPGVSTQSECAPGPGSGAIPFASAGVYSSAPTVYANLPFFALDSSADNGFNNNAPDQLQWTWQNGTTFTGTSANKAWLCGQTVPVSTACTAGNTNIPGSYGGTFTGTLTIRVGNAGTAPTAPYGTGCNSFAPVDPALQGNAGSSARGSLQCVLRLEIKNSGTTGMCVPGSWLGVSPISVSNNSPNDIFYLYIVPDYDVINNGGGPTSVGPQGAITFNCATLVAGNSCSSCLTLAANFYPYFSTKYFSYALGNNPETPTTVIASAETTTLGING